MEVNKIYHDDWMNNQLPDKSVQLIIADPPYFEVKGDFDFVWKSFDDYLTDVEKWAIECKRLLAENGTLYWFGGSKKIAYTQVIFDKYFGLVNNLVWEKAEADGLFGSTGSEQLRSYPNSTERILMYSNEDFNVLHCYDDSRKYMYDEIKKKGHTYRSIDKILFEAGLQTEKSAHSHLFINPKSNQGHFVTKEQYTSLQNNGMCLCRSYDELKIVYDKIRSDYEETRRQFENITKSTEILKVRFKPSEYDHPTVKPEMLARLIILTSSRKNDLVLIPFAGSGTEVAMAIKEGRKAIGFDIEKKYVEMGNKRTHIIKSQPSLFAGL